MQEAEVFLCSKIGIKIAHNPPKSALRAALRIVGKARSKLRRITFKEVINMNMLECLQQRTGSCLGCNIYEIAKTKSKDNPNNVSIITDRVNKTYCPKGIIMRPVEIRKQKVW